VSAAAIHPAGRVRRVALPSVVLLAIVAWLVHGFVRAAGHGKPVPAETFALARATAGPLPPLWKSPDFSYVDQRGHRVTSASLQGTPWIADFIFTSCTSACPMMTSRMVLIQRALDDADVRFVSFSVDPAHDSPAVLADYADAWNASEARWMLLATEKDALPSTLEGFHVTAERTDDTVDGIVHSSVFLLVDASGWVRGVYDLTDPGARDALVEDARRSAKSRAETPPASSSEPMHRALGCNGCHSDPRVAPPLAGLRGSERTLEGGETIRVDDAYLRRSILDPGFEVVNGYSALMPSYRGQLSETELTALIGELDAMPAAAAPAQGAQAPLVTDPVCRMAVRADPATIHVKYEGRDVYFCSESCRHAFVANPRKFTGSDGGASKP